MISRFGIKNSSELINYLKSDEGREVKEQIVQFIALVIYKEEVEMQLTLELADEAESMVKEYLEEEAQKGVMSQKHNQEIINRPLEIQKQEQEQVDPKQLEEKEQQIKKEWVYEDLSGFCILAPN